MERDEAITRATRLLSESGIAFSEIGHVARFADEECPHWSIAFMAIHSTDIAESPGGPIVQVFDDGRAEFFDVL